MTAPATRLVLTPEPFDSAVSRALIEAVQSEYVVRYGGADTTPVAPEQFAPPDGRFLVAWLDGRPVGSGGWRRVDSDSVEIKRMYVVPDARGLGVARALLAALETAAHDAGYRQVRLETGTKQPEAIALYLSAGYLPVPPFGVYAGEPDQRCFGKTLHAEG